MVVGGEGGWPPEGYELPVYLALVNTVILVTSSFSMHWALQSIKRNNRSGLIAGLTLTFLLGLTFLLIRRVSTRGSASARPTTPSPRRSSG